PRRIASPQLGHSWRIVSYSTLSFSSLSHRTCDHSQRSYTPQCGHGIVKKRLSDASHMISMFDSPSLVGVDTQSSFLLWKFVVRCRARRIGLPSPVSIGIRSTSSPSTILIGLADNPDGLFAPTMAI